MMSSRRKADAVDQDVVGARGDRHLALERIGLARFVKRHDDDRGAVAAYELRMADKRVLALLERDRIDHRLALHAFQSGFDHREFGGVDHQRHAGDVGLRGNEIEKRRHRLLGIEQALVHVDIEDLRAVFDLVARHRQSCRVIAGGDELAEARRAGDVGTLADIHERNGRRQREGFEAGKPQQRRDARNFARRLAGDGGGDGADVIGRSAATTADDIGDAGSGEFADQRRHGLGTLVVMAEFVGQAGIRICADQCIGDARELGDVRAHLFGAECAIQPDRERRGMRHRIPKRLGRLPGEQPSGAVGNGARNHYRHADAALFHRLLAGEDGGLGVERVEDGLDQQRVDAAIDQSADLFAVGNAQFVEGDGAKARIENVGRDRCGPVGRADRAGDETLAAVLVLRDARGLASEAGAFEVQFVGDFGHAVVGLRDARRGERVGRDDVGAGAEIGEMNGAHRARPAEIEEIVVTADLAIPGVEAGAAIAFLIQAERLDHCAHGAVEHEDPFGGEPAQRFFFGRLDH
jgi:hypothetical protein